MRLPILGGIPWILLSCLAWVLADHEIGRDRAHFVHWILVGIICSSQKAGKATR